MSPEQVKDEAVVKTTASPLTCSGGMYPYRNDAHTAGRVITEPLNVGQRLIGRQLRRRKASRKVKKSPRLRYVYGSVLKINRVPRLDLLEQLEYFGPCGCSRKKQICSTTGRYLSRGLGHQHGRTTAAQSATARAGNTNATTVTGAPQKIIRGRKKCSRDVSIANLSSRSFSKVPAELC